MPPRVRPRSTWEAASRASCCTMRRLRASSPPSISRSSPAVHGRCRPVATCSVTASGGSPPRRSASRIGGSSTAFGTGRVRSEITITASRRPRASSASGWAPIGRSSALAQGGRGIAQRSHRALLEQSRPRAVGQLAGDLRASVGEGEAHRATVSPAHALRQSLWYRASTGGCEACARVARSGRCSRSGSRSRCRPRRTRTARRRATPPISTASTRS